MINQGNWSSIIVFSGLCNSYYDNVIVTNNFAAIKGTYTVKYVATDASGNSTTKLRKVIVK